jgi:catechol 2,3-dioxygenase-like lactoylglutathione lyase family enzyme
MARPALHGIHHLKLPVSDLDTSLAWYERVLGAVHLDQFDHIDSGGHRFAVIVTIPGVDVPVELRWAPRAASAIDGYDPISLAGGTADEVASWTSWLDEHDVPNSGVRTAAAGALVVFRDPDGTAIRVLELPPDGVEGLEVPDRIDEPDDPWVFPPSMQHPRAGSL